MQVQWKSERVPDKTALHNFFLLLFFSIAKILLKLWMHMHMLTWNFIGLMFSWKPAHNYM